MGIVYCWPRRRTMSAASAVVLLMLSLMPAARAQSVAPGEPVQRAVADSESAYAVTHPAGAVPVVAASPGMWGRFTSVYRKGGVCMHALLLCAVLGLVLIIERMWALWRVRIDTRRLMIDVVRALRQEGPRAALRVCENTRGPIANILHAGLLRTHRGPQAVEKAIHTAGSIETASLERGLLALSTISRVAPLIGFLGTVAGMIRAFAAIAAAGEASATIVARGIEEALITTAAGLLIAVPVSAFHAYFVLAVDRFVLEMEGASSELVDELLDIEDRKSSGPSPAPATVP